MGRESNAHVITKHFSKWPALETFVTYNIYIPCPSTPNFFFIVIVTLGEFSQQNTEKTGTWWILTEWRGVGLGTRGILTVQTGGDKTQKPEEEQGCQVGCWQLEMFAALATRRHCQFSDSPSHQPSVQKAPQVCLVVSIHCPPGYQSWCVLLMWRYWALTSSMFLALEKRQRPAPPQVEGNCQTSWAMRFHWPQGWLPNISLAERPHSF